MTAAVIDMAQAREARVARDIHRRVAIALPIYIRMQEDLKTLRRVDPSGVIREAFAVEWARACREPPGLVAQVAPLSRGPAGTRWRGLACVRVGRAAPYRYNRMGACDMADDTKDDPDGSPAYLRALAAVEAFGKMSPEEQRQFEADLMAMARADGLLPRTSETH